MIMPAPTPLTFEQQLMTSLSHLAPDRRNAIFNATCFYRATLKCDLGEQKRSEADHAELDASLLRFARRLK